MQKRSNLQLQRNNIDYSIPKLVSGCCDGLAYFSSKNSYKNTCHAGGYPIYILIANYSRVSKWTKGVACRPLNITEMHTAIWRTQYNNGWRETAGNLFLNHLSTINVRKAVFLSGILQVHTMHIQWIVTSNCPSEPHCARVVIRRVRIFPLNFQRVLH
jgi:hypothetical protein